MLQADFGIAVHPGEILQEMLEEVELTPTQLARHLRTDKTRITEICRRRRGVSVATAVLLGRAFGMSPRVWLNLQQSWELSQLGTEVGRNIRSVCKTA